MTSMICGMENKDVRGRAASTRRAFLSATAVTAVAAPCSAVRPWPRPTPRSASAVGVGNVTSVTLNMAKDNVQFGLRAIDTAGHRSPAAFPQAAT
jgi:hypothetical protein